MPGPAIERPAGKLRDGGVEFKPAACRGMVRRASRETLQRESGCEQAGNPPDSPAGQAWERDAKKVAGTGNGTTA